MLECIKYPRRGGDALFLVRCPSCGSGRVRKSRRRGFVAHVFLRLLGRRRFRCLDCDERFRSRYLTVETVKQEPSAVATRVRNLWSDPGMETSAVDKKSAVNASQEKESVTKGNLVERRVFSRLDCEISAQVIDKSGSRLNGVVSDISLSGCFVEARNTLPVGSEIGLSFEGKAGVFSQGLVRSQQTRGMGIEFILMTAPSFRRLQDIAKGSVRLR